VATPASRPPPSTSCSKTVAASPGGGTAGWTWGWRNQVTESGDFMKHRRGGGAGNSPVLYGSDGKVLQTGKHRDLRFWREKVPGTPHRTGNHGDYAAKGNAFSSLNSMTRLVLRIGAKGALLRFRGDSGKLMKQKPGWPYRGTYRRECFLRSSGQK